MRSLLLSILECYFFKTSASFKSIWYLEKPSWLRFRRGSCYRFVFAEKINYLLLLFYDINIINVFKRRQSLTSQWHFPRCRKRQWAHWRRFLHRSLAAADDRSRRCNNDGNRWCCDRTESRRLRTNCFALPDSESRGKLRRRSPALDPASRIGSSPDWRQDPPDNRTRSLYRPRNSWTDRNADDRQSWSNRIDGDNLQLDSPALKKWITSMRLIQFAKNQNSDVLNQKVIDSNK